MAEEKTEQPTPEKLRKSRQKGQVGKSADLTHAFLFLAAGGVLSLGGAAYIIRLRELMSEFFRPAIFTGEIPPGVMLESFGSAMISALTLCMPLLIAMMLIAVAIQFLQVKALFAPEVIKPKLDKLNPIEGFKNIFFKAKTYVEMLKNLVKLAVIAALVYYNLRSFLPDLLLTARVDIAAAASLAGSLMFRLLFQAGAAFVILGAADYMIQMKFYRKDMMMSKEEVKREFKESEGDPHIKAERKHLHQEMLAHGSVANVQKADAVIVNPVHLAVAIRYDEKAMGAPQVTAKGREELADKIRALARKHNVPIVENIALARSLYSVDLGHEIPEELYEPVAEILNWVYQLSEKNQ
jgi:type III secretion YscU/HrpY family protein